jgi:hypothetical protein
MRTGDHHLEAGGVPSGTIILRIVGLLEQVIIFVGLKRGFADPRFEVLCGLSAIRK